MSSITSPTGQTASQAAAVAQAVSEGKPAAYGPFNTLVRALLGVSILWATFFTVAVLIAWIRVEDAFTNYAWQGAAGMVLWWATAGIMWNAAAHIGRNRTQ